MRRLVARRPGALADVLALEEVPRPGPGPGEVAVEMLATTVNPSDAVTVSGTYASRTSFPFVPGFEGVGRVCELGAGAPADLLGRRVLPVGSAGTWQQVKVLQARWCVPVPDDLPDEVACFAYVNPLTAWLLAERVREARARTVVVTAARSAIAGQLAQLLGEQGIRPVGLVRRAPDRPVAEPWRWAGVVATDESDWPVRLAEAVRDADGGTTRGVDVVVDCLGGPVADRLVDELSDGGTMLHFGLLSGVPLSAASFDGRRGTRVEMVRLRDVVHTTPADELPVLFAPVFDRLRAGGLRTTVGARVPLTGLAAALGQPTGEGKLLIDCQA